MYKAFLIKQSQDLSCAFEIYEQSTSRNIRSLAPVVCLNELANIPKCRNLIRNLIAAEEIGANDIIEEVFTSVYSKLQ